MNFAILQKTQIKKPFKTTSKHKKKSVETDIRWVAIKHHLRFFKAEWQQSAVNFAHRIEAVVNPVGITFLAMVQFAGKKVVEAVGD